MIVSLRRSAQEGEQVLRAARCRHTFLIIAFEGQGGEARHGHAMKPRLLQPGTALDFVQSCQNLQRGAFVFLGVITPCQ